MNWGKRIFILLSFQLFPDLEGGTLMGIMMMNWKGWLGIRRWVSWMIGPYLALFGLFGE